MTNQLEALSVPGGRGRAACARVSEFGPDLANALRRAVPFIARRRIGLTPSPSRCAPFATLAEDPAIVHASAFSIRAHGAKPSAASVMGLVLFDDIALARILDGILGGEGAPPKAGAPPTSAQGALASRVTGSMFKSIADVLSQHLGLTIEPTVSKEIEAGTAVVLPLLMEGGGQILLALPLSVISVEEETSIPPSTDSGLVAAMTDVELEVVAELGKVSLSLEALARLQVGDVIRLPIPLDERARVCAGGATIFHGRPTASGDVVAVAIEGPAEEQ
jgi:flagellar motor switch protein FliM